MRTSLLGNESFFDAGGYEKAMAKPSLLCYRIGERSLAGEVREDARMPQEKPVGRPLSPILFTAALLLLIAAALGHAILRGQGHEPIDGGTLYQLGRWIGKTGLVLLLVIYGRSALRRLLRAQAPWQRLGRLGLDPSRGKAVAQRAMPLLNRTHPYMGAAAATLIILHCYAISDFYRLLPLRIVLALIAWQALLGLTLKAPWTPALLKRRALLLHAQILTGGLLAIFAGVGHYRMIWG